MQHFKHPLQKAKIIPQQHEGINTQKLDVIRTQYTPPHNAQILEPFKMHFIVTVSFFKKVSESTSVYSQTCSQLNFLSTYSLYKVFLTWQNDWIKGSFVMQSILHSWRDEKYEMRIGDEMRNQE